MQLSKKRIAFALLAFSVMAVLFVIGRAILLGHLKNKLEEQLYGLRDNGYIVQYDSITVNWKENSITVYDLKVKRDLDTLACSKDEFISTRLIKAAGLRIFPLLFRKRLSFETLHLDSPQIALYHTFFQRNDTVKRTRREFSIQIDDLQLPQLTVRYFDSLGCSPATTIHSSTALQDFMLAFHEDRPASYNLKAFTSNETAIDLNREFYNLKIHSINLNRDLGVFFLDTLRITPHLGKVAFGRKKGFETDRVEGLVPYINFYGLAVDHTDSLTISSKRMTTQIFLKLFRDKRLPFQPKPKALPIELLNRLSFGIKVDSLILNKSYVEYEEYAVGADSAGKVYFDNLYATIRNIDNTKTARQKGESVIIAEADFMGQGDLRVEAVLPRAAGRKYTVRGELQNLDMKRLNLILEPQIRMRAESGRLNSFDFNFSYNNDFSTGQVRLNYNDLRVVTFQSEKRIQKREQKKKRKRKNEEETDPSELVKEAGLKTFIVNNFIVRRDMDSEVPQDKRTGEINFERDKNKSIFNYWAKSLFSGIKSAYNLDRLEQSRVQRILNKKDKK